MKACQYVEIGAAPRVRDVPVPEPGPGQVLLKVSAAGVCHSDDYIMSLPAEQYVYGLPLTLGHEGAGVVEALGAGTAGIEVGDAVVVYGPWGCGRCHNCARGAENYCVRAAALGIKPPGLGNPGAIAEYLLVDDPRHLVSIGDLDPVAAAPLTDAGLTPYHAIKRSLPKLQAGSTAVVLGVGGLGHLGVQLLRAISPARVVALDVDEAKLELAREVGAHEVLRSEPAAADAVREMTDGVGADVVLDFVGVVPTVMLAKACAALASDITIVGIGGGALPVSLTSVPFGTSVTAPYWGTRDELIEVIELARLGAVRAHVEPYPIEEAPRVYEKLHQGQIVGRAVILPGSGR